MGGVYGVTQITKLLVVAVDAANVIDKITSGGSFLLAFGMLSDLSALSSLDRDQLAKEVAELDAADRANLVDTLKTKLVLINKVMEKKIEDGADILNEAVYLAADVAAVIKRVQALFAA